ncbi:hypothetical protein A3I46_00855 [Candidatus Kaiserbacteria bacterium RIFCSPLOWO2_02_FULL_54_13]|nr:MAG: hypothetical protein A3I46_00855 [Candidatus Kaiserbacteria bacterium RIFCSPLOWO2_02_FULL_54_13]
MAKDWTKLVKAYKGLWVALAEDEITVLGAGKTVQAALLAAKEKSNEMPFLTHVPDRIVSYVGSI